MGHLTHRPGNEKVDLLARQTISSLESTEIETLPYNNISKIINHISFQEWRSQWHLTTNNKLKFTKTTIQKW